MESGLPVNFFYFTKALKIQQLGVFYRALASVFSEKILTFLILLVIVRSQLTIVINKPGANRVGFWFFAREGPFGKAGK